MSNSNLLDLYDLALQNEAETVSFPQYDPPFRAGSFDGSVSVWLVEDTSVETAFDPSELDAREFVESVFDWVDAQKNK